MAAPPAAAESDSPAEAPRPSPKTMLRICSNCTASAWARWRARNRNSNDPVVGVGDRMSQKRPLVFGLMAVLAVSLALAQQKPAAPPALTARDFSKEAYTIERRDVRIAFEDDGTGSRQVSSEIKILADAGVKAFAVLNFTYTSANETVDIDYVRVRKPDGTVVKTPDYNVQDMPADVTRTAPLYSDVHEKHVAVKGLSVGDVLEYQVRYRVVKPEVAGQFWQEYSFTKSAISKDERLEISVPAGKYVKVVSPEFKPEVTEVNGRRIYRWHHANLIIPEKDQVRMMPAINAPPVDLGDLRIPMCS